MDNDEGMPITLEREQDEDTTGGLLIEKGTVRQCYNSTTPSFSYRQPLTGCQKPLAGHQQSLAGTARLVFSPAP